MANLDTAAPGNKGASLPVQGAVMLGLTLLAIGGGWFAGVYLRQDDAPEVEPVPIKAIVEPMMPTSERGHGQASGGQGEKAASRADEAKGTGEEIRLIPRLVPLEPITTNIAAPSDIWVRMEVSVVFTVPPAFELTQQIHQDILAYMRTLTLHQIKGGSGFRHLKADLEERVRVRSEGLATALMIRTLLFE